MPIRIVWILCTLIPFLAPLDAVMPLMKENRKVILPQSNYIKLLVVHDKPGVVLEVKGQYKLYDPNTGYLFSTRFKGKRKFMQAVSDGLKWGEEFPSCHQVLIVPDSKDTTTIVDGIEYKGRIYVYDIGGAISVVNELTLDDYVMAMLCDQYQDTNVSEEAMNALMIAARTNAYYQAQNPGSSFWTIDARKINYQGHALLKPNKRMETALAATRNMVLSEENTPKGQIKAFPAAFGIGPGQSEAMKNVVASSISVMDADGLAKKGENAAKILSKAYPKGNIKLLQ